MFKKEASKMAVRIFWVVAAFLLLSTLSEANPAKKEKSTLEDARLEYLSKWAKISEMYQNDEKMRDAINHINWYHDQMKKGNIDDPRPPAMDVPAVPFNCKIDLGKSTSVPQTAHELRPGDINVVASFGDSITAGNGLGAEGLIEVAIQNRGESWCVGGDFSLEMNVTTLPNMIKEFNPNLMGQSSCNAGVDDFDYSWFNAAVPGARAVHMPEQAMDMINKMKNDARIEFAKDWKVITLFIGGNDFCSYCENRDTRSPDDFIGHIMEALDMLHDQVPRAFVNLVPMADVGFVKDVYFHYDNTSYPGEPGPPWIYPWACDVFHQIFCPCVMNETTAAELKNIQLQYFDKMEELVDSGRYDTKSDFVVVLQPHLRDSEGIRDPFTGMIDNRYFSPDCFHPNRRLHQALAFQLWNVMLTKVGEKPYGGDPAYWTDYICPSEEFSFLSTKENSKPPTVPPTTASGPQHHIAVATVLTMLMAAALGRQ